MKKRMIKTKCPMCMHQYNILHDCPGSKIKVCNIDKTYKEVGRNRATEIKGFWKKNELKRMVVLKDVEEFIENEMEVGDKKSTQNILFEIGLQGTTKGDLLRIILDNYVCLGLLSKQFQKGRKGHIYTKLTKQFGYCPYWNDEYNWCSIFFNDSGKKRTLDEHTKIIDKEYVVPEG